MALAIVDRIAKDLSGTSSDQVKFELNEETIAQIGAIVMQIVTMLKSCKKTPEEAVTTVNNPKVIDKQRVRAAVRKELGFFKNRKVGADYVDAVLKAGYTASLTEVKEAWTSKAA